MEEKFVTLRINGIDTDYVISNKGRIMTKNGEKQKRTQVNHFGYEKVALQINKKALLVSVHRAVYESFVGDIPKGMQINHKDGDKLNNCLENLEVVTPSENMQHAWKTGLCKKQDRRGIKNPNYRGGEYNPTAFHTEKEAIAAYTLLKETKMSHKEIAAMLNVDVAFVDHISKGLWADVTGFNKEDVRRNQKFTKEDEIVLWYLYTIAGKSPIELERIMNIPKESINNKIGYIKRNKKDKLDAKVRKRKSFELVYEYLGGVVVGLAGEE